MRYLTSISLAGIVSTIALGLLTACSQTAPVQPEASKESPPPPTENYKATIEAGIQATMAVIEINKAVSASLTPPPTSTPKPTETPWPTPTLEPAVAYQVIGEAALAMNQYHEAIEAFSTSLRLNPSDPSTYIGRAKASMYIFEYTDAVNDINAALALNPKLFEAYLLRVDAKSALLRNCIPTCSIPSEEPDKDSTKKEWLGLAEDITAALALPHDHDKDLSLYMSRGVMYTEAEEYETALLDLNRAISLDDESIASYIIRGIIHEHLGNTAESKSDRRTAACLDDPYALKNTLLFC